MKQSRLVEIHKSDVQLRCVKEKNLKWTKKKKVTVKISKETRKWKNPIPPTLDNCLDTIYKSLK